MTQHEVTVASSNHELAASIGAGRELGANTIDEIRVVVVTDPRFEEIAQNHEAIQIPLAFQEPLEC